MTIPQSAIGYCAVILPTLDEWQGFFIIDDPAMQLGATRLQAQSLLTMAMANPYGALQAVMVEGFLQQNHSVVGAAALALKQSSGHPFFYIRGRRDIGGTSTELIPLKANTIIGARTEIENLPEVMSIKQRLSDKLRLHDGMGRRKGFH